MTDRPDYRHDRHRPDRIGLRLLLPVLSLTLAACSIEDSRIARRAPAALVGLSEADLESCLGAPDQHASFGRIGVDTYNFSSAATTSYTIPIVGGLGRSNGGNCKASFRIEDGRVARVLYSGEKNATFAPDAYCAPIVRTCLDYLDTHPQPRMTVPAPAPRTTARRDLVDPDAVVAAGTGTTAPTIASSITTGSGTAAAAADDAGIAPAVDSPPR